MEIKDYVALFLGLVGTTLGLINLYRDVRKSRVRAVVKPFPATPVPGAAQRMLNSIPSVDELRHMLDANREPQSVVIQITNCGAIPLHIMAVGFLDPSTPLQNRFYLITPRKKGEPPGERLDPNEQKNIDTELSAQLKGYLKSVSATAFVELGGGRIVKGSTPVFDHLISHLKSTAT
jgi:hypothetical protein